MISQRPSIIKNADRILVIEDSQTAEIGTHSESLRKRGKNYTLYTQQFCKEREAKYGFYKKNKNTEQEICRTARRKYITKTNKKDSNL